MAASSPRCVQQLATSPDPILTKPISPPAAALTLPLYNHSPTPTTPNLSLTPSAHTPPPFPEPTPWVATLLNTKFYGPCPAHPSLRKNDQNLFCTTHAQKICQYCYHAHHARADAPACTVLHVSRYMYHDVLLAKEAAALLDIADVQSYLNNGNRVVYIDRRAQPKSKLAPHAKSCVMCARTLQDPYTFCSLFCRLRFANDPAATEAVPLPDATPLLHPAVRKVKHPAEVRHSTPSCPHSPRGSRERECPASHCATPSPPNTPLVRHVRKPVRVRHAPSPLRLPSIKKRKRKSVPNRSPLPTATLLMLAEVATVFMCD